MKPFVENESPRTNHEDRPVGPIILVLVVSLFLLSGMTHQAAAAEKLKVGVVLHPYYSWVTNIAGDAAEVVPLIPADQDPHSYQPRPEDLANLSRIDVIVVNGLGHDEFIFSMLEAADCQDIETIRPNDGLPLIPVFEEVDDMEDDGARGNNRVSYNSHSYIAITGAIQQINSIARELARLDPENAELYRQNALAYTRRLRKMLAGALTSINELDISRYSIATVHDGYAYLFQELGLQTVAVIQPRHGIEPSAKQLADTIDRIKAARVNVLFAELDYDKKYVDIVFEETGCKIYSLSHISHDTFTPEKFETDMQHNLDTIVQALSDR